MSEATKEQLQEQASQFTAAWTMGLGLPPAKPAKARREWREEWRKRFRAFCAMASTRVKHDSIVGWLAGEFQGLSRGKQRIACWGQEGFMLRRDPECYEVPRACYWPALEAIVRKYPDAAKQAEVKP